MLEIVLAAVVSIVINAVLLRWIFSVEKQMELLKQTADCSVIQMRLLTKMLLHQGVPLSEIDEVIKNGNSKKA